MPKNRSRAAVGFLFTAPSEALVLATPLLFVHPTTQQITNYTRVARSRLLGQFNDHAIAIIIFLKLKGEFGELVSKSSIVSRVQRCREVEPNPCIAKHGKTDRYLMTELGPFISKLPSLADALVTQTLSEKPAVAEKITARAGSGLDFMPIRSESKLMKSRSKPSKDGKPSWKLYSVR